MTIYYLDLVNGNDSSDGLTTSTPKKTLNAITALPTAVTDEVKVRGMDSLLTNIGNWTWTDESRVVTASGDLTASVAANDYICKTVDVSGTVVPEIYKVNTVVFSGGITTITLLLTTTYNAYYGTTETVATSKLVLPTAIATQLINKNGFYSGTLDDYANRVFTKITGGWNSDYTSQSTYTFLYGTVNNLFNFSAKLYWELSKFIVITTTNTSIALANYSNVKNTFSGWGTTSAFGGAQYVYLNNVIGIGSNSSICGNLQNGLMEYSKMLNSRGSHVMADFSISANNCVFAYPSSNVSKLFSNTNALTMISTSTMKTNGSYWATALLYVFDNCTLIDTSTATGQLQYIQGLVKNCSISINKNRSDCSLYNGLLGTVYEFYNNTVPNGENPALVDLDAIIYNCTGFKLRGNCNFSNLKWYNNNNEDIGLSDYIATSTTRFLDAVIYSSNSGTTANAKLEKKGYTTLSTEYYPSKSGGTNSIKHVVSDANKIVDFYGVEFVINKNNGYNLSFYTKGTSTTLSYNIFNGGEFIFSSWETATINNTGWTQATKSIISSDWNMSGTAQLVIRLTNEDKDAYALIDYISLT